MCTVLLCGLVGLSNLRDGTQIFMTLQRLQETFKTTWYCQCRGMSQACPVGHCDCDSVYSSSYVVKWLRGRKGRALGFGAIRGAEAAGEASEAGEEPLREGLAAVRDRSDLDREQQGGET